MPIFSFVVTAVAILLAVATTRGVERHGAAGMNASMATMMAAMGSGLSVGYGIGTVWGLAAATFAGVLAGGAHGLWMGRRYGPMAALEGAGGGVMGGLMGPMLAIMLLYTPASLLATAALMLGLQAALGVGAVYLVAAAAGRAATTGWQGLVGRVLDAGNATAPANRDLYAVLGVQPGATTAEVADAFLILSRDAPNDADRLAAARDALAVLADPVRRARYEAQRQEDAACCAPVPAPIDRRGQAKRGAAPARPRGRGRSLGLAGLLIVGAIVVVNVVGGSLGDVGPTAGSAQSFGASGAAQGSAAQPAAVAPDGSQQVDMTLSDGRYTPSLVQVKSGTPVRLAIKAIGDPG